jgi:hypothetical protein
VENRGREGWGNVTCPLAGVRASSLLSLQPTVFALTRGRTVRCRTTLPPPGCIDRDEPTVDDVADFWVDALTDAGTRAEFSHELHFDASNLAAALADCTPARSLEMGCGYGRLTPRIAACADEHSEDAVQVLLTDDRSGI